MQEILPLETANMLLDAATTGKMNQSQCQEMLTTLLGANLNIELPNYITDQIRNSHRRHSQGKNSDKSQDTTGKILYKNVRQLVDRFFMPEMQHH